jgi:hypothetical protein
MKKEKRFTAKNFGVPAGYLLFGKLTLYQLSYTRGVW